MTSNLLSRTLDVVLSFLLIDGRTDRQTLSLLSASSSASFQCFRWVMAVIRKTIEDSGRGSDTTEVLLGASPQNG